MTSGIAQVLCGGIYAGRSYDWMEDDGDVIQETRCLHTLYHLMETPANRNCRNLRDVAFILRKNCWLNTINLDASLCLFITQSHHHSSSYTNCSGHIQLGWKKKKWKHQKEEHSMLSQFSQSAINNPICYYWLEFLCEWRLSSRLRHLKNEP